MPAQLTYPGVYVEEIPSGVRTITGVATSVTAFLGRAVRGPTDEPTEIHSFGDFERLFGGLDPNYPMSYAVRDFFVNRGSHALIARIFKAPAGKDGFAHVAAGGLNLRAASAGPWGQKLRIEVDLDVAAEVKTQLKLQPADAVFNLTIRDTAPGGSSEKIRNVSVKDSPRRLDKVLEAESNLVRWDGDWPAAAALPNVAAGKDSAAQAEDALAAANKQLATAKKANPQVPADIAAAQQAVDAATTSISSAEDATNAVKSDPLDADAYTGSRAAKTGLYLLEKADLFNLLCIPPDTRSGTTPAAVYQEALAYCVDRRAMLIVDPPADWTNVGAVTANRNQKVTDLNLAGVAARNAAAYFPRVREADPKQEGQIDTFVPCGLIAGIMARTDEQRGVWKAPAGLDAALSGVDSLAVNLTDDENGQLNPLGINCLRSFPVAGRIVWGARTLRGADQLADEYKYVPVRRLALYIEESLYRGTQWVVFEPNDEPLWAQIRLNVGAFMHTLFRQGAFQGTTPRDAYFVKCDKETTTQDDINHGIVNIVVGFAPLKPAEFVVIKLQQMAGQIEV